MKGHPEVIATLNRRLADEHTAIVQYVTHARMCENWGYQRLASYLNARSKCEMRHAGMVLDRILFLGGIPDLSAMGAVVIGADVSVMFANDQSAELAAVAGYTESIDIAVQCKDYGTRELMERILTEEDAHLNDIEANMTQIQHVGIENYLPTQIQG